MTAYYSLSRDYSALYELISNGSTIVGFVDHKWMDDRVARDVCKIIRHEENRISIGSRGMGYGSVDDWDLYNDDHTEKNFFIEVCKSCNLEWIKEKAEGRG